MYTVIRQGRLGVAASLVLAATFGSASAAAGASTLFRVTDLELRDPHVFFNFAGCRDVTDSPLLGFSINGSFQTAIHGDTDPVDGYLDLSYLLDFQPLDQAVPANALRFGKAQCTAPEETSTCLPIDPPTDTQAALAGTGTCLAPLLGTVHPYVPAVASTTAPCFASGNLQLVVSLAGIPATLQDLQIAATFDAAPAQNLANGLLRGFLSEADANSTLIPASYPVVGGQPLSSILPGGATACPAFSDKDMDGATVGWWLYFNFQATTVPAERVFADGFE